MDADSLPIVDCHVHFVDVQVHSYPIFQQRSAALESLVGDYSTLPRRYLPEDYLKEAGGFKVVKTIWAEFMSDDPVGEASWAQALSHENSHPHGLIVQADFLSSEIVRVIDCYGSLPHVRAVRQHLAFQPGSNQWPARPDVLEDSTWRDRLALLRKNDLRCELEILAPQLPGFANAARFYPDIQFVLPLMGWPTDLTDAGHQAWKRDMKALSGCKNVAVKIFGMECLFGLDWTTEQVRPWILETIDFFGPERCMFASHMPIGGLARSFQDIYGAYFDVVSDSAPRISGSCFTTHRRGSIKSSKPGIRNCPWVRVTRVPAGAGMWARSSLCAYRESARQGLTKKGAQSWSKGCVSASLQLGAVGRSSGCSCEGDDPLGPRSSHVWDPIAWPAQHFASIERPTSRVN